jgi:dolichyl-phosphate-mannose-protein mannosyltransferase
LPSFTFAAIDISPFSTIMSSLASLRKRGGAKKDATALPSDVAQPPVTLPLAKFVTKPSEWDYKVALFVVTALAFATRFYKITYPAEVVFDEVHFGKVCSAQLTEQA